MFSLLLRVVIPVLTILAVSEVSRRSPRLGALLLTLPLVSILAFGAAWSRDHDDLSRPDLPLFYRCVTVVTF